MLRSPLSDDERAAVLEKIIVEAEAMRGLAKRADLDFLAFLLENVLAEAQSTPVGKSGERARH